MKAMILAAGLSTRLLPLTEKIAKPAMPFANRPLIHYCLGWLVENGVGEVVINLHYQPQSIISAVRQRSWPLRIHFSREPNLLGTAGGVKKAEKHFGNETFVMVNSDSLFEIDLAAPIAYHRETGAVATMVLKEKYFEDAYGTVSLDAEGRIVEIRGGGMPQQGGKGYLFTGIHLLEPEVFNWIPPGRFFEINQTVYPLLIQKGRGVWGFVTNTSWAEVGNHETYLQAHRDYMIRRAPGLMIASDLSDRVELIPPVIIGKGCHVESEARIGPAAVVGEDCLIGRGAAIENSVIWNKVTIGPRAEVRGSIVGHETTIDPGAHLEGMVASGRDRRRIG